MDPCGNPFVKTLNRPLDMRRGYAPYIYIYEKMKYFFGYAPRFCAATFALQHGPGSGYIRKEEKSNKDKEN